MNRGDAPEPHARRSRVCRRFLAGASGLAPAVTAMVAALAAVLQEPINDDDVYHLHSIWLTGQGALPYRDFFEFHPPGMWILLGPIARLFETPSLYLLTARSFVALLFGLAVWLGSRACRIGGLPALVLALLAMGAVGRSHLHCFRVEYVAVAFTAGHLFLLADDERLRPGRSLAAAAVLALACTMSVRPWPLLAAQPVLVAMDAAGWRAALRRLLPWATGLLAGALPAVFYLTFQGLWPDAWFWAFRYGVELSPWGLRPKAGEWMLLSAGGLALLLLPARLAWRRRRALVALWLCAGVFFVFNPFRFPHAHVHFILLTVLALAAATTRVIEPTAPLVRAAALVLVGWGLYYFVSAIPFLARPLERDFQRRQLLALDWLRAVAGSDPVVLIPPHHPMTVRDATDLQHSWQYSFFLDQQVVRRRLRGFAPRLLEGAPAVIAANPWTKYTGGRDLVGWLRHNGVMGPNQARQIREMLDERYVRVALPLGGMPFGDEFWVRSDRFVRYPPPFPCRVLRSPAPTRAAEASTPRPP
jgi:hypothetical protein